MCIVCDEALANKLKALDLGTDSKYEERLVNMCKSTRYWADLEFRRPLTDEMKATLEVCAKE